MRRASLAGLVVVVLASTIAVGVVAWRRPAAATGPLLQLRRTESAGFLPAPAGDGPFFVLAIGSDARPGVCMPVERCLADSIQLIGVNPQQRAATILGFPRDAYVTIPGEGSDRINESLRFGGPELVVRTVQNLTGIRIDYYLLTSFQGFTGMVDDIGGIEVDIPYPMDDPASGARFSEGRTRLDGQEALAFSRNRKDAPDGDFSRSQNHGRLLVAALTELRGEVEEDPAALFAWIVTGMRNVQTDLPFSEVFDLMLTAASIDPRDVTNCVAPGSIAFVGPANVVQLSPAAERLYDDLKRDGLASC